MCVGSWSHSWLVAIYLILICLLAQRWGKARYCEIPPKLTANAYTTYHILVSHACRDGGTDRAQLLVAYVLPLVRGTPEHNSSSIIGGTDRDRGRRWASEFGDDGSKQSRSAVDQTPGVARTAHARARAHAPVHFPPK